MNTRVISTSVISGGPAVATAGQIPQLGVADLMAVVVKPEVAAAAGRLGRSPPTTTSSAPTTQPERQRSLGTASSCRAHLPPPCRPSASAASQWTPSRRLPRWRHKVMGYGNFRPPIQAARTLLQADLSSSSSGTGRTLVRRGDRRFRNHCRGQGAARCSASTTLPSASRPPTAAGRRASRPAQARLQLDRQWHRHRQRRQRRHRVALPPRPRQHGTASATLALATARSATSR